MTYKILIVDDEIANLRLMERLFRRDYQVITALSGKEGLELLKQHDIALIMSDQRMPEMTGVEFLKQAAGLRPHTVRLILTGYTDVTALVEAINSGVVYKYITKPWINEDLIQTVKRGVENYEGNKQMHNLMINNQRLNRQVKAMQGALAQIVTNALNAKDETALGHARRTSGYAMAIGARMPEIDQNGLEQLSLAALLHSIGQLGVPGRVFKIAELNAEEKRMYTERMEKLLMDFPEMSEIALAVRYHHEHFDGSGYPEGLDGERIPLFSRIIAVASAYDEMTSHLSVDKCLLHEQAVARLKAESGKIFDPEVVETFCEIDCFRKLNPTVENLSEKSSASLALKK